MKRGAASLHGAEVVSDCREGGLCRAELFQFCFKSMLAFRPKSIANRRLRRLRVPFNELEHVNRTNQVYCDEAPLGCTFVQDQQHSFYYYVVFLHFIVLVLTIMAILLHDKFTQAAERSAELSTRQIVDQVSYNLEDYVRSMSHLYRAIEEHMLRDGTWEGEQVDKQLDTLLSSREDIISITLLDANGQLLKNRPAAAEAKCSCNSTRVVSISSTRT